MFTAFAFDNYNTAIFRERIGEKAAFALGFEALNRERVEN